MVLTKNAIEKIVKRAIELESEAHKDAEYYLGAYSEYIEENKQLKEKLEKLKHTNTVIRRELNENSAYIVKIKQLLSNEDNKLIKEIVCDEEGNIDYKKVDILYSAILAKKYPRAE